MLLIPVAEIPDTGSLVLEEKVFSLEDLGLSEPFVQAAGAILSWNICRVQKKFLAQIKSQGRVQLQCGRCLDRFEKDIQTNFLIEFEQAPTLKNAEELSPNHPGVSFVLDAKLNLGEEIRQELELAVPLAGLCQGNCKGLCGQCGINLNRKSCSCGDSSAHRPFSGLQGLLDTGKTAD